MVTGGNGHRGRALLAAVAVALAVAGGGFVAYGLHHQVRAPVLANGTAPATPAGVNPAVTTPSPAPSAAPAHPTGPVLAAATPTRLQIPAIGVDSSLTRLGLNPDRTVQVPPLSRDSRAGWYRYSPAPGQLGPSIILGHIDSAAYGPGVFFRLAALKPGALVSVSRADHTVAVFRVDSVQQFPKNHFPTLTVYGNTDHAALRLITCGGKFDFSAHSYTDNIVAFASLVSSRAV